MSSHVFTVVAPRTRLQGSSRTTVGEQCKPDGDRRLLGVPPMIGRADSGAERLAAHRTLVARRRATMDVAIPFAASSSCWTVRIGTEYGVRVHSIVSSAKRMEQHSHFSVSSPYSSFSVHLLLNVVGAIDCIDFSKVSVLWVLSQGHDPNPPSRKCLQ